MAHLGYNQLCPIKPLLSVQFVSFNCYFNVNLNTNHTVKLWSV